MTVTFRQTRTVTSGSAGFGPSTAECVRINAPLDRDENVRGDPRLRSASAGCLQLSDVNQTTLLAYSIRGPHPTDRQLVTEHVQAELCAFSDTVIQSTVFWLYFYPVILLLAV